MNAFQILRKTSIFGNLPGQALIVSGFEINDLSKTQSDSFWYRGKEYKDDDEFLRVSDIYYCENLLSCYGEVFAMFGYDQFSYYLFKIEN